MNIIKAGVAGTAVLLVAAGVYAWTRASGPSLEITADVTPVPAGQLPRAYASVEPREEMSGGETSVRETSVRAFGRSVRNLKPFDERWRVFHRGKLVFDRDWTRMKDSPLGPLFSSEACKGCHVKDGRGRAPASGEVPETMVMQLTRLSPNGEQRPDPDYGAQLDYYAMSDDEKGEGTFGIGYDEVVGSFADGTTFTLRRPRYRFFELAHGELDPDTRFSPRVAPALYGLGLLEAIPEQAILALADPDDNDRDGISGRPNRVYDVATRRKEIGRFGWKANQPSIAQQIARAYLNDMGITTSMYPRNASLVRTAGDSDRDAELSAAEFDDILFYTKLIAVPERRDWTDARVLRGKALFHAGGCDGCHAPQFTTGELPGYPELSHQQIRPYTDLLLHDMGEGLADDRPDALAGGREWRTAPLWGIGLFKNVNYHTFYLHDGRARNVEEAVLWHGGEALRSQRFYRGLSRRDRAALLVFLQSL